MRCPKCNRENSSNAQFCDQCRHKILSTGALQTVKKTGIDICEANYQIYLQRGRQKEEQGMLIGALSAYKNAQLCRDNEEIATIIDDIERKLTERDYQEQMKMGQQAEEVEEYEQAEIHYQAALKIKEDDSAARQALEMIPDKIVARDYEELLSHAQEAEQRQNWNQALRAYQKALQFMPEDAEILAAIERTTANISHDNLATIVEEASQLQEQHQYTQAIQCYQRALEIDSQNEKIQEQIANCQQKLTRYTENVTTAQQLYRKKNYRQAMEIVSQIPLPSAEIERLRDNCEQMLKKQIKTIDQVRKVLAQGKLSQANKLYKNQIAKHYPFSEEAKALKDEIKRKRSRTQRRKIVFIGLLISALLASSGLWFGAPWLRQWQKQRAFEQAYRQGQRLMAEKSWQQAIAAYRQALIIDATKALNIEQHIQRAQKELNYAWAVNDLRQNLQKQNWQRVRKAYYQAYLAKGKTRKLAKYKKQIPKVQLRFRIPKKIIAGISTTFSLEPADILQEVRWKFGNGITSKQAQAMHTYLHAGKYQLKVVTSDGVYRFGKKKTLTVRRNRKPQIRWRIPQQGLCGKKLSFETRARDPERQPLWYSWDFGDGSKSRARKAKHAYSRAGTMLVTLTVSDGFHQIKKRKKVVIRPLIQSAAAPQELLNQISYVYQGEPIIDMSCETWLALSPKEQKQIAADYRTTYARRLNMPKSRELAIAGISIELALIPPGRFIMGSPPQEYKRDPGENQHPVIISRPFYIGKYEITQKQWQKVMADNPAHFRGRNKPVERVSWKQCQQFCLKTGLALPTEAQWEYACRAGTTTPFNTGVNIHTGLANYRGSVAYAGIVTGVYRTTTTKVGTLSANSWDVYDFHGNVWEWCADWFAAYPTTQQIDPYGPRNGSRKIFRGGSWYSFPEFCRSAKRMSDSPQYRSDFVGFRVVSN